MGTSKPRLVILCVLFAPIHLLLAQGPDELSDDALLSRVSKEIDALVLAGDADLSEVKTLDENETSLREAHAGATAKLSFTPDSVEEPNGVDEQTWLDEMERRTEYLQSYRKREKQLERIPSLTEARRRLLNHALESLDATRQRAADLRPLLNEVAQRLATQKITPERASFRDHDVDYWAKEVDRRHAEYGTWLATYRAEKKEPENATKPMALESIWNLDTDRRLQHALDVTTIMLQAARHEVSERKELEQTDHAALPAVVARVHNDWRRETAGYESLLARTEVHRVALADLETNRRDLASPSKESIPEGQGHVELKKARRDADFSNELVKYLDARLKLVREASDTSEALMVELAAGPPTFERLRHLTIKLKVTLDLADRRQRIGETTSVEVPEGVSVSSLATAMRTMADVEASRRQEVGQLEQRQDKTAVRAATEQSDKEIENNHRLHNVLQEELSYAAVLQEMAAEDEASLVALVQPGGTISGNINQMSSAVKDAQGELDRAEQELRTVRDTIRFVENPYVRMGFRKASNRLAEIKAELEELKDGRLPEDRSADPLLRTATRTPADAINGGAEESAEGDQTLLEQAKSVKKGLEKGQDFATAHWQYFNNLAEKIKRYTEALDATDKAFASIDQARSALVNEEKRKYACALELQRRLSEGRIDRSRVPFDFSKALTRETITQVRSDRDERARAYANWRNNHQTERDRLQAIAGFGEWAEMRADYADTKATLISQPVQRIEAAAKGFDDLAKVDRQQLEYNAKNQREADDVGWESLLASVSRVKKRKLFDESLDTFYLTIARIDHQLADYTQASEVYQNLIEQCNTERSRILDAPEELKKGVGLRALSYQTARHLAAVAASTSAQLTIEDAFKKAFGSPLPIPEQTHDWDKDYWANRLFAAEARLWGHLTWTQDVRKLLSKLGLDAEIAQYDQHEAKIENKIRGLTGLRENHRDAIAAIRSDYSSEIYGAGLRTLISLLLIPLLAWIIVRLVNRFAGRIEARAMDGLARDRISYHERMKTISSVSRKTVSVVVWVIAGLYLLHALGTPVSTILASAGVMGLAFAFGAQALIRDFFHGFFILLENQYTIGDWIEVGGIGGTVERLTLRVTVLRDMEGTLHFIPNGAVTSVSNMTHGWSQVKMEIGIGYGEDLDRVTEVILDAAKKVCDSDSWKHKVLGNPVVPGLQSFGDSCLNIRLVVKTQPGVHWGLARALRKAIKERFDAEGIEIPFPQRVIHHVHPSDSKTSPEGAKQDAGTQPGTRAE